MYVKCPKLVWYAIMYYGHVVITKVTAGVHRV